MRSGLNKFQIVICSLLIAVLVGTIAGFGIFLRFTADGADRSLSSDVSTYTVADNGYSGNSTQALLPPVTEDAAVKEIADGARRSVVTILAEVTQASIYGNITGTAIGSGVVYEMGEETTYIITNAHVVDGAAEIALYYTENDITPCTLQGQDKEADLAVLAVSTKDLSDAARADMEEITWGDSDAVRVGDLCIAVGCPYDPEYTDSVTVGIVSGTEREITVEGRTLSVMQTDAAINPGNSGGATVDREGKLIGINSAKVQMDSVEGMGFFIPSNLVKPVVDQLIESGSIDHPSLGVASFDFISEAMAKIYDVPMGLIIYEVDPGTTAYTAGLQSGDIITEIDGETITSLADLDAILNSHAIGDTVELTVIRGRFYDQTLTLQLKLSSAASEEIEPGSFFGN